MLPNGPSLSKVRQTIRWQHRPTELLSEAAARYGTPFTLRLLGRPPAVILSDPEHVRMVFKTPDLFQTGVANQGFITHIGPHSLLTLDGADHQRHRRMLSPHFQDARMGAYTGAIWTGAVARVEGWSVGEEIHLLTAMYDLTFDLILDSLFGISDLSLLDELRRLAAILTRESSSVVMVLPFLRTDLGRFSGWGRFLQARREWDRIIYAAIDRALETTEERSDILGMLARQGSKVANPLSRVEIHDELMTLLAAGHATTAVALTWAFQRTLASPDLTRRVREEVRDQFESGFQPESLDRLSLVDAVIQESLRLHPPILLLVRQLVQDASIAGFDLPRGTLVRPSPYLTHRDPRCFPDPEEFRPERFLNGRPGLYEYYPFGGGLRSCIGGAYALRQMRIIFAAIMAYADLALVKAPTHRASRALLLAAPEHGTPVRVERRFAPQTSGAFVSSS